MARYICEVRSDPDSKQLELVHTDKYQLSKSLEEPGAITFQNIDEFNRYFTNHCISREELKERAIEQGGGIFTMLFWLLLLVFIITIIVQVCNSGKSGNSGYNASSPTAFGRFSF